MLRIWYVGGKTRVRYNDSALYIAEDAELSQAQFWSRKLNSWLKDNGRLLECDTIPRFVTEVEAVRCQAPRASLDAKISLMNLMGFWGDDKTVSVPVWNFELWLTKRENIPIRLTFTAAGLDAKRNTLSGSALMEITRINSKDISVNLPRSLD